MSKFKNPCGDGRPRSPVTPITTKLARYCIAGTVVLAMSIPAQASAQAAPPPPPVIEITTLEQLRKIGEDPAYPLDGHYELMNDIDASAAEWMPIGRWFVAAGEVPTDCRAADCGPYTTMRLGDGSDPFATAFSGTFDGKGRKITGLKGLDYAYCAALGCEPVLVLAGLFGSMDGATVKDLFIEADTITVSDHSNHFAVGTLAGFSRNSTITNVHATGTVRSVIYHLIVTVPIGGLVGRLDGGSISGSSFTGAVISDVGYDRTVPMPGVMPNIYAGGLVGENRGGTITGSTAEAEISGLILYAGGLVGKNDEGTINRSEATIILGGGGHGEAAGGLVGANRGGTIADSDAEMMWAWGIVGGFAHLGELVGIEEPASSVRNRNARTVNRNTLATATVRGKTLNINTPSSTANLQIRLIDVKGRTLTRFNMTGASGSFSLSRIPTGRYFVDMRDMDTGRRSTSSVVLR